MIFRQCLHEPLAAASYLIGCGSSGEAAVVDPGLPPEDYVILAANKGLHITTILETHLHADYVSTGRALARLTNATIYAPSRDDIQNEQTGCSIEYEHVRVDDGDEIKIGNIMITAIHTPGHTPEHMSYTITDTPRADRPWFVLTGDCLFVGDVGRADLVDLPMSGPRVLYKSLKRLLKLDDYIEIYPCHYGGSACGGKSMSGKVSSTISFEKKFNWGLALESMESFVEAMSDTSYNVVESVLVNRNTNRGILPLPSDYYAHNETQSHRPAIMGLSPQDAAAALKKGAVLIDLRTQAPFCEGHPKHAINVPFSSDSLCSEVAALTARDVALITISETPFVAQHAAQLLAAGGPHPVLGYIDRPVEAWMQAKLPTANLAVNDLKALHRFAQQEQGIVLDVRDPFEWEKGVIEAALLISVPDIREQLGKLDRKKQIMVTCESGARACMVASMLCEQGYSKVEIVAPDGMGDYAKKYETIAYSD